MSNIPALRDELEIDPLGRGYASMTDDAARDSLNEQTQPAEIESQDVERQCQLFGVWAIIADAAKNEPDATKRLSCLAFVEALRQFPSFDMTIPEYSAAITGALTALESAGYLTAAQKATILELGDNKRSRAQQLGLGILKAIDIADSRA